ncbi:MAG TPA: hypothetical protein PLD02_00430 [Saprospiraceae bacterium]|nr:hypothetical protein [Saprospiraceae bacterium]
MNEQNDLVIPTRSFGEVNLNNGRSPRSQLFRHEEGCSNETVKNSKLYEPNIMP